MRILFDGQQLKSVLTDAGEGGHNYIVGPDKPTKGRTTYCREIVVSIEAGNTGPIPFGVCVLHSGQMKLANLTRCSEVELKDNVSDLPTEAPDSGIILPNKGIDRFN